MGRTSAIVKRVLAMTVVAMVLVFLVDLLAGPVFSFSTHAWPPARQGDKVIGGIQGLVKATDSPASTVRISAGFLGLGSLPVVVTPETRIAVNGKLGGFGDLDRGQRVRVTYEVQPDRLVAASVELLERSSDASDVRLPDEQSSGPMALTSSSPRVMPPAPVAQRDAASASPSERSARPPTSAWSRTDHQPERATPPPVTSMPPIRPRAEPGAPRNARDAVRPASSPATARAPQALPAANAAAPDPDVRGRTMPDAKPEATALAPIVSTVPPTPSVSAPLPSSVASTAARETPKSGSQSAPFEPALLDKIRNDWEAIKHDARRSGDEWRDGWRRLQRLFTD